MDSVVGLVVLQTEPEVNRLLHRLRPSASPRAPSPPSLLVSTTPRVSFKLLEGP